MKLMKRNLHLLVVSALILAPESLVGAGGELNDVGEWQILTKQNFSAQIQLHPHILLIVTVPWSGESRSLTKELSDLGTRRQGDFSSLKLMIMYRNDEKMLAGAIGAATEGITVLYYHHSVSYKYGGKLRARDILLSVYPYIMSDSVSSKGEFPFTVLTSSEELKTFIESTDKALILFEFCGWTQKLLRKEKSNSNATGNGFSLQGNPFGLDFNRETEGMQVSSVKEFKKGRENGELKCGVENEFSRIPQIGLFSLVNDSDPMESENVTSSVRLSCNLEEFGHFDSFFSKFVNVARELLLGHQRHRFGLVSERSLLKYLGVEDSDSWFAMLYSAGCPSCTKILKEGNDLRSILQIDNGIISELDRNDQDFDTVLPANKPSVVLFVDRASDSSETRRKSKEALDAYRVLAMHYSTHPQIHPQKNDQPGRHSVQATQASRSASGHPILKLSTAVQKFKLKDKMSIMILDDSAHVSLDRLPTDLQGNTLHEILAYLLQKRKEIKLSSLAKEVGFHLSSDDLNIKISDTSSPSQLDIQPNQVSPTRPEEGLLVNVDVDKDQLLDGASMSVVEHKEDSETTDISSHHGKQKIVSFDTKEQLLSQESDQDSPFHDLPAAKDVKMEEKSSIQECGSEEPQLDFHSFTGSFFFCDGNYRLLKTMTGGSTLPSLVIVDPISQQHYVSSKDTIFNYSSMNGFLLGFLNGSLLPYRHSKSILQRQREATHPPFVNMDFHEVDSIPQVTVHTFSEMVLGLKQPDNKRALSAWNEDVAVLFSSSWCGFCQRMELVVREVYRAIKGYMKILKNRYKNGQQDFNGEGMFVTEDLKNIAFKLPRIYLMDCTLNDCSEILKSMTKREVYPALILFPAERKNAIPYEGNVAVADVMKFIADHGKNSHDLTCENGILWSSADKRGRRQKFFEDSSQVAGHKEVLVSKESFREVILKSDSPKDADKDRGIKSHSTKGLHEIGHRIGIGFVLVATDKLVGVHPFDNSKILIVKADEETGFQGLIFNKHIKWDTMHELQIGLEFLKAAPLSFGGPLIQHGMPLVSLSQGQGIGKNQYPEIAPGIYFLDQSATVNEIEALKSGNHSSSIEDCWFFLGYSSWGHQQLFDEIAEGAWTTSHDSIEHLDWPSQPF